MTKLFLWPKKHNIYAFSSWFLFDLFDLMLHYLSVKFIIELWNRKLKINETNRVTFNLYILLANDVDFSHFRRSHCSLLVFIQDTGNPSVWMSKSAPDLSPINQVLTTPFAVTHTSTHLCFLGSYTLSLSLSHTHTQTPNLGLTATKKLSVSFMIANTSNPSNTSVFFFSLFLFLLKRTCLHHPHTKPISLIIYFYLNAMSLRH